MRNRTKKRLQKNQESRGAQSIILHAMLYLKHVHALLSLTEDRYQVYFGKTPT